MEKLSENKGKYYFLFKKKIFYSDTKYDYRLSLNSGERFSSSITFRKTHLFLDENTYHEIVSMFNPYSDYSYTNIEKSDIIVYDIYNRLTYLYYGCFFETISEKEISIKSDYTGIVEDPNLIKSNIRSYKLNNLIE